MASNIPDYTIEIPKLARIHFHSRRTAAVVATTFVAAALLGALCWGYTAYITAEAARQRAGPTTVSDAGEVTTARTHEATVSSLIESSDRVPDSRAVYIYVETDPKEDKHGAHLYTCPGRGDPSQTLGCSYLYSDTERSRLDIRIQVGTAVEVQLQRREILQ